MSDANWPETIKTLPGHPSVLTSEDGFLSISCAVCSNVRGTWHSELADEVKRRWNECRRAEAENARLREALQPFAVLAEILDGPEGESAQMHETLHEWRRANATYRLTQSALRTARAALEAKP